MVIVLSGGIGAGKSAVGEYLRQRGWPVLDADEAARAVTEPGTPAWRAIVDAFGTAVLRSDGSLDRAFLADVVFRDAAARRRLEAITHPAIHARLRAQVADLGAPIVFVAVPLYEPALRAAMGASAVWAVVARPETALARLVGPRGLSEDDARRRLASQVDNDARRAWADVVIENDGTLEELHTAVDRALAALGAP